MAMMQIETAEGKGTVALRMSLLSRSRVSTLQPKVEEISVRLRA